jgi:group I intron endonuclease
MMGIYKITNKLNNKAYVGLSVDIENRWKAHTTFAFKKCDTPYHKNRLYSALRKYGVENFKFEVIEECEFDQLKEREIYWIAYYDTFNNGYNLTTGGDISGYNVKGENHPNAKLTEQDVINIRSMYANLERRMYVYELYKDRISVSGFIKIWQGETWRHIMMNVYTPETKEYHSKNSGMVGSKNGRSKVKEEDIYNIRLRKSNGETLRNVYKDYSHIFSYSYFKHIWYYGNWKHITV